jgi:hypothetical protein
VSRLWLRPKKHIFLAFPPIADHDQFLNKEQGLTTKHNSKALPTPFYQQTIRKHWLMGQKDLHTPSPVPPQRLKMTCAHHGETDRNRGPINESITRSFTQNTSHKDGISSNVERRMGCGTKRAPHTTTSTTLTAQNNMCSWWNRPQSWSYWRVHNTILHPKHIPHRWHFIYKHSNVSLEWRIGQ